MRSKGCVGYPSALTREDLGLLRRRVQGQGVRVRAPVRQLRDGERAVQDFSSPAEFHAQTAVECAMKLHPQVAGKLDQIERIEIETQEAGVRIIDKTGPLANYADRDHCIQYMVAVPLIFGRLTADDYDDDVAADPRIDALRDKMTVEGESAVHQGLFRSGQALHRQLGAGIFQGRQQDREGLDRLSDRPSQASRRRHSGAAARSSKHALAGHLPARQVGTNPGEWQPIPRSLEAMPRTSTSWTCSSVDDPGQFCLPSPSNKPCGAYQGFSDSKWCLLTGPLNGGGRKKLILLDCDARVVAVLTYN